MNPLLKIFRIAPILLAGVLFTFFTWSCRPAGKPAAEEKPLIEKPDVDLTSDRMTPEVLWGDRKSVV